MTTGSISAATATLFMMADITPAVVMMITIILDSLFPASLNTKWPMAFALGIGFAVVSSWFFDGLGPFLIGALIGVAVGYLIDNIRR